VRTPLKLLALVLVLGIASFDSEAARRFGGGGNLGKQRPAPTANKEAPAAAPATTPASPNQAAAAKPGAPAAPAPQPSFMQRWGGMLAGLGIGVLLASLFGAQLGPIVGLLLAALLGAGLVYLIYRVFAGRNGPAAKKPAFAGIGSAVASPEPARTGEFPAAALAAQGEPGPQALAPAEIPPFLRVAKTSFIRLQAANDAKDLDDLRDYTTPEMFAEISMQMQERGAAPQKTEVVALDAQLVENVVEGDHALASVRFSGLIRENDANNPEPFDEIWNVRKKLNERNGSWLIAGIQQSG
jgi:predicted lipid-binding transport protein (Tim44 family)